MKKMLIALLFIASSLSYSQISGLQIVTKNNDTLRRVAFKSRELNDPRKNYKLQDEIEILNSRFETVNMKPADVKSFSFKYGEDVVTYESREGKIFALVLYDNKIKLLRFKRPAYTSVDIYVVERPDGKTSFLEAMGLSRRISLKVIKREMTDCPATIANVENDILKIHGEPGVLELVRDYETSCY